jgi:hypothetical protein
VNTPTVTVTLPELHARRWCTYLARRVHHATAAGGTAGFLPALTELHRIVYEATEEKRAEYSISIPPDLLPYARSYGYVARRLPA